MSDSRDADVQIGRLGEGGVREHVPLGVGHESRDVRIRPIVVSFVVLGIVATVVVALLYVVLQAFTEREQRQSAPASPLAVSQGRTVPPEPRLQIAPRADLRRLREREEALLSGYGWVDRDAGVARIPIERAIELLATRGLPAAAAPPGADGAPPPGAQR